jgi:hypothetical protein
MKFSGVPKLILCFLVHFILWIPPYAKSIGESVNLNLNGRQFSTADIENSIKKNINGPIVDSFFKSLSLDQNNEDLKDADEPNASKNIFYNYVDRLSKAYLLISYMSEVYYNDESGFPRNPPLNITDQKKFKALLKKKMAYLNARLKNIRAIDPNAFDSRIYSQTSNQRLPCNCDSFYDDYLEDKPPVYDDEGQVVLQYLPNLSSIVHDLSGTAAGYAILIFPCANYEALSQYSKSKHCQNRYVDRILSKQDGVLDGYVHRFGLPGAQGNAPSAPVNSPLGDCSLDDVNKYSVDVIDNKIPGDHSTGRGEAALDKPCTLVTLRFNVQKSKMGGETHQLLLLRYRGSDPNNKKPLELNSSIEADRVKLQQILTLWREQRKSSGPSMQGTQSR